MKQEGQFWKGKAVYAGLALVIAGAAFASVLSINSMMTQLKTDTQSSTSSLDEQTTQQGGQAWELQDTPVENKQENVSIESTVSSKPQETQSSSQNAASSQSALSDAQQASLEQSEQPVQQTVSYTWPVQGSVLQGFTGDELVYNATMQDWRTHNGIDIASAKNNAVKSPIDGVVETVIEQDGTWGGVIEIKKESGEIVRLCGVENISVAQGREVKQGETLGVLGEVACEAQMESHLHVEILTDGQYKNPQEYFPVME